MEHLDLTSLADRAGVPVEDARRYRDAYVLFIPAVRVGRTIGFPVEAVDVLRLIADREAAGDAPAAVQAALEAAYPVTVLSAQPIAPGDVVSPDAAILEILRGVDARYAALAAHVAGLTETVADTVAAVSGTVADSAATVSMSVAEVVAESAGSVTEAVAESTASIARAVAETAAAARPAAELAELRALLAAAQSTIDAGVVASRAATVGQLTAQTAIAGALADQSLQRTTDHATLLRAADDLAAALAAEQGRATAADQALTSAQANLAASTHAEHQALFTASAATVASTHAEHQALLAALDRQRAELAAVGEQQTRLQADLAALQQVVPTLATAQHVDRLGAGVAAFGKRLGDQIGERLPTAAEGEEMVARIAAETASQTADGVGTLLDTREATLVSRIDAQLTALARHVESRIAQLDRRVSAIASIPGDGGPSQTLLLDRITALTRQVSDEAILQNAAFERIASERDEATRLMGQLVAEALATIQHEVRTGVATASADQAATHRAVQAAQVASTPAAPDALPLIQLHAPNGQPIATTTPTDRTPSDPATLPSHSQRPSPVQTWTDHLVAINGVAATGVAATGVAATAATPHAHGDPARDIHGGPTNGGHAHDTRGGGTSTRGAVATTDAYPLASSASRSRIQPSTTRPASVSASGAPGDPTGRDAARPSSGSAPPRAGASGAPDSASPPPTTTRSTPADATSPGLPNRRRLGHPLRPGDLTQSG